ncbi:putative adenine phosphoribosyltransferase [Atractiella rhizophila]|nr:putative adenine phosphoribosyltransferase [Atractiella rhizophila]
MSAGGEKQLEHLQSILGRHHDWPKPGITFIDIFPLFQNAQDFECLITYFMSHIFSTFPGVKIDVIVGLEARGFLLGPIIAMRLGAAFVPVRKKGKLPGKCIQATYIKEYGEDIFEMQEGAIKNGQKVLVIDDLIATGGSAKAAGDLVSRSGAEILEYLFIIELTFLKGTQQLSSPSFSIIKSND